MVCACTGAAATYAAAKAIAAHSAARTVVRLMRLLLGAAAHADRPIFFFALA
jgi:hypothetical protein